MQKCFQDLYIPSSTFFDMFVDGLSQISEYKSVKDLLIYMFRNDRSPESNMPRRSNMVFSAIKTDNSKVNSEILCLLRLS